MIIALHGITCVGKTTVGELLAKKLGYPFYDLDLELKKYYNDTISNIKDSCFNFNDHEYNSKQGIVLKHILSKIQKNAVIAVSPIYYTKTYKTIFLKSNVFQIVLEDDPKNIANRMIMTDDDDNIIEDYIGDFKEDLIDVKYFISRYKSGFDKIPHCYNINGQTAEFAATELAEILKDNPLAPLLSYRHFSSWMNDKLKTKLPAEITALNLIVYEVTTNVHGDEIESYDLQLHGYETFDETHEDLTINEIFNGDDDIINFDSKNLTHSQFDKLAISMAQQYVKIGRWHKQDPALRLVITPLEEATIVIK